MQQQFYKWVKASERKSTHYESVCCRRVNEDFWFTAFWDNSKGVYCPRNASGQQFHKPEDIEWLEQITLHELQLNGTTIYVEDVERGRRQ